MIVVIAATSFSILFHVQKSYRIKIEEKRLPIATVILTLRIRYPDTDLFSSFWNLARPGIGSGAPDGLFETADEVGTDVVDPSEEIETLLYVEACWDLFVRKRERNGDGGEGNDLETVEDVFEQGACELDPVVLVVDVERGQFGSGRHVSLL